MNVSVPELTIKGNWNEIKGQLKQKYGELTANDLAYVEGKEDELLGTLQQKLGKTKEQVVNIINEVQQ